MTSHHECAFGKWYDGDGQVLASEPVFAQVGATHEQVHALAREIVSLVESGNRNAARDRMANFEHSREELFNALDTLYRN